MFNKVKGFMIVTVLFHTTQTLYVYPEPSLGVWRAQGISVPYSTGSVSSQSQQSWGGYGGVSSQSQRRLVVVVAKCKAPQSVGPGADAPVQPPLGTALCPSTQCKWTITRSCPTCCSAVIALNTASTPDELIIFLV